jgi:hypothetical protein
MPKLDIRLNIRNKPPGQGQWPPNGFTECQNNSDYAYKYAGGTHDDGKGFAFEVKSPPVQKIVDVGVIGAGSHSYDISSVTVTYDDRQSANKDVTVTYTGSIATFTDTCENVQSGSFTVFVDDTSVTPTVTNIECDPRWENR